MFTGRRRPTALINKFHMFPVDDVEKVFDHCHPFINGPFASDFILKMWNESTQFILRLNRWRWTFFPYFFFEVRCGTREGRKRVEGNISQPLVGYLITHPLLSIAKATHTRHRRRRQKILSLKRKERAKGHERWDASQLCEPWQRPHDHSVCVCVP